MVVDWLQVVKYDREEVLPLQQTQLDEHAFTADTAGAPEGVETLRFLRQLRGPRFGLAVVTLKGGGGGRGRKGLNFTAKITSIPYKQATSLRRHFESL